MILKTFVPFVIIIDWGKVFEQIAITTPAKVITNPIHIKVLYCDSVSEWCKDFFKRISVVPHKIMQDSVNKNQIIFTCFLPSQP